MPGARGFGLKLMPPARPHDGESSMLLFLWDMYQSQQIARVDAQAATARSAARDASDRAQDVERRIDALMLTNMAMWSLLSERLGITDRTSWIA